MIVPSPMNYATHAFSAALRRRAGDSITYPCVVTGLEWPNNFCVANRSPEFP